MSFDEQPTEEHGECREEIRKLEARLAAAEPIMRALTEDLRYHVKASGKITGLTALKMASDHFEQPVEAISTGGDQGVRAFADSYYKKWLEQCKQIGTLEDKLVDATAAEGRAIGNLETLQGHVSILEAQIRDERNRWMLAIEGAAATWDKQAELSRADKLECAAACEGHARVLRDLLQP